MYRLRWWWIWKIGQAASTRRLPSCDSLVASFIFACSSSIVGSIISQPSGGALPLLRDIALCWSRWVLVVRWIGIGWSRRVSLDWTITSPRRFFENFLANAVGGLQLVRGE